MKLKCKLGLGNVIIVDVRPEDPLYVLLIKLKIEDKGTHFLFNGIAHSMASIETFQEIGLTYDTWVNVIKPAISGKHNI